MCLGGGGVWLWKKDNEGHVVMLGVELTCFKKTFRLKISTRLNMEKHNLEANTNYVCVGTVGDTNLINTGKLIDCNINEDEDFCHSRSQWQRGLRHGPAAACFLGLRFRIPPRAWMSVCCQ